jgi:predicted Zn-dependent protease
MAATLACGVLFAMRATEFRSERILYEALLAKAPASPPAKAMLASSMLLPDGGARPADARELVRAEALLREAVTSDPTLATARLTLQAVVAQRRAAGQRPLPADVEFMVETVRLFPSLPQVHGMLGRAYFEHSMNDRARTLLEKELTIMPLDLIAANTLAQIHEAQNEKARADEVISAVQARWQAVWRRFPGFGPVAVAYARALATESRDLDGARSVLREAAERACRPADRQMIDALLEDLGGK